MSVASRFLSAGVCAAILGCARNEESSPALDYRAEMRALVRSIDAYGESRRPGFITVPQNGLPLLTENGESSGPPARDYLSAIDGVSQESVYFSHAVAGRRTAAEGARWLEGFLDLAKTRGLAAFVTDYTDSREQAEEAGRRCAARGYVSFAADTRELTMIPDYRGFPQNRHGGAVRVLGEARNYLLLLNSERFRTKDAYLGALRRCDYDLLVLDAFFSDGRPLEAGDLDTLRPKPRGGRRLLLAYVSVGEAEEYRHYWKPEFKEKPPAWLDAENPDWPGNYKVRYWTPEWRELLIGGPDSYVARLLAAGFDGVYLDVIDAFEHFEERDKPARPV